MLKGKKTYIIAFCTVAYGAFGFLSGNMDGHMALLAIMNGLGFAGLRNAL